MLKKMPAAERERDIKKALSRYPTEEGSDRDDILAARNFVRRYGGPESAVKVLDRLLDTTPLSVALRQLSAEDFEKIQTARNFLVRHGGFPETIDVLSRLLGELE